MPKKFEEGRKHFWLPQGADETDRWEGRRGGYFFKWNRAEDQTSGICKERKREFGQRWVVTVKRWACSWKPVCWVGKYWQGRRQKSFSSVQVRSVTQLCLILCDLMACSMPGFSVHHQLPELAQTHVHCVSDAIQSSHSLSSPSPPAFNLAQHDGLFHWVSSLHQVAKVLELQLQHQPFQWIFRTDFV